MLGGADIGHPQLEHTGRQREGAVVGADIAQLFERQQDTARRWAGESRGGGHLAEAHRRAIWREGADDIQPPRQRLDEIRSRLAAHDNSLCISAHRGIVRARRHSMLV